MESSQQIQNPPLSSAQMESLQKLVKQFKDLVNRYQKSCIPQLADSLIAHAQHPSSSSQSTTNPQVNANTAHNYAPLQGSVDTKPVVPTGQEISLSGSTVGASSNPIPNSKGTTGKTVPTANRDAKEMVPSAVLPPAATVRPPPAPPSLMFPPQQITTNLSWQCFHSILFYGLGKAPSDGSVGFALSV